MFESNPDAAALVAAAALAEIGKDPRPDHPSHLRLASPTPMTSGDDSRLIREATTKLLNTAQSGGSDTEDVADDDPTKGSLSSDEFGRFIRPPLPVRSEQNGKDKRGRLAWTDAKRADLKATLKRRRENIKREMDMRDAILEAQPELKALAKDLFLFADASQAPLVSAPATRAAASSETKDHDRFFAECVLSFAKQDDGNDPRPDKPFENFDRMTHEEILGKVDANLAIIKKMNSIIKEKEREGVSLKPTLIRVLADRIRWPDPTDFLDNCVLVGPMPPCTVYPMEFRRKMLRKNRKSRADLLRPSNVKKSNEKMIERVMSQDDIPHLGVMREEAKKLESKGKLRITSLAEFKKRKADDGRVTLLTPNFGVQQNGKVRQCTDNSERGSDINGACEIINKTILHDHRFLDDLMKRASKRWRRVKGWKSDLKGAYRQLPLDKIEREIGTMLLGDWVMTPTTLGFGSRAAVFHFTQFSLLMTTLVISLTATPALVYIDDEFGVLPDEDVKVSTKEDASGKRCMADALFDRARSLHELCGVELHPVNDEGKSVAPTYSLVILGIRITLHEGGYSVSVDEAKMESLRERIEQGIDCKLDRENTLKLAGALGFLAYGFRCRMARGYLAGLFDYCHGGAGPEAAKTGLIWWRENLHTAASRDDIIRHAVASGPTDYFLMCPDASKTHSGIVVLRGSFGPGWCSVRGHFCSERIPATITRVHSTNSPLRETCAIVHGILVNAPWLVERDVLVCGDCKPANVCIAAHGVLHWKHGSSAVRPISRSSLQVGYRDE
jgi:hypothetical protein